LLFSIIALLAAWHHVALGGFTTPRDGNDVVHGEFPRWKISAAIVTLPFGELAFPPLTFSQFSRLTTLAFEITFFWRKKC